MLKHVTENQVKNEALVLHLYCSSISSAIVLDYIFPDIGFRIPDIAQILVEKSQTRME